MVKTKSVYDPVEESDGQRILVSRYWPRGLSKERLSLTEHLKDVAPSIELLQDWKTGNISWIEYEKRYHQEMSQQQEKISELAKRANGKTITLLCFEREDNPHSQASIEETNQETQIVQRAKATVPYSKDCQE